MKDRIKKFYEDHEEAILIGGSVIVGAVIGARIGRGILVRQHKVVGVDLIEIPNETRKILVFKQNGMVQGFQEPL